VNGSARVALRQVARVFRDGTLTGLSDPQLLDRFVEDHDEAAFEALLVRHGPMVQSVCRRLLRDPSDAEDAFQAIFLVLVRKANSVRVDESLGPWLYTVAVRVAARARAARRRLRDREGGSAIEGVPAPATDDRLDRLEVPGIIHEELARLPGRLRVPLVLCYLEGMTHDRAAGAIGCPVGTVRSRLARARGLLQKRMARRGLTLSAGALMSALASSTRAASVSPQVRISLVKTATRLVPEAALVSVGLGGSQSVAALTEGVLHMFRIKKIAVGAGVLLSVGLAGFVLAQHTSRLDDKASGIISAPNQPDDGGQPWLEGRPIGSPQAPPDGTFAKTYYVGDLVLSSPRPAGLGTYGTVDSTGTMGNVASTPHVRTAVNLKPIITLIASTVAPGTWNAVDGQGHDLAPDLDPAASSARQGAQPQRVGSITPFFLSMSLIIRCTAETHVQVAGLLKGLRDVVYARDGNGQQASDQPPRFATLPLSPPPAAPGTKQIAGSAPESTAKIERLLDELRTEIAKLPRRPE
jgi:RNA polymerase sigma factor (sigma-70 family)